MTTRKCATLIQILVYVAVSASAFAAYQYVEFAPDFAKKFHISAFNDDLRAECATISARRDLGIGAEPLLYIASYACLCVAALPARHAQ
jgi:hypothetical protein